MRSYIQTNSVQQFLAAHRSSCRLSALSLLLTFFSTCFPIHATAATATDTRFRLYIRDICLGTITPPAGVTWDTTTMCTNAFAASNSSSSTISTNLGTSDVNNSNLSTDSKKIHECVDDFKSKSRENNCATGGWGVLLSTQFGRNVRSETELENGFQSDLLGILIGLDYRFSDSFILGTAASQTRDEAKFINDAGSLTTKNNILTLYSTWLPSEKVSVDGYLGYGAVNFDSQRKIIFGTSISGTAIGNTTGRQAMAGLSSAYQAKLGNISISPFFNLDYIKTDIKGYNESGTTNLELHYIDRSTISSTASLGGRMSKPYNFSWGSLTPSLHGAGVHEFQNNSSLVYSELVITPGGGISVATDEPDRDYFLSGFGVTASLNSGTQLFMNYEKRSGDSYLDSWVVSLGLVKEF